MTVVEGKVEVASSSADVEVAADDVVPEESSPGNTVAGGGKVKLAGSFATVTDVVVVPEESPPGVVVVAKIDSIWALSNHLGIIIC